MQHCDDHNAQSNVNNGITSDVQMVAREWYENVYTAMRMERRAGRAFSATICEGILTADELFVQFYLQCPAGSVMLVKRTDKTVERYEHIAAHPAVGSVLTVAVPE